MSTEKMSIVGKAVPVMEARDKVTGKARYVDDFESDLFIKILGSPHPHAMITRIDTENASTREGVKAIITYKNAPQHLIPFRSHRPCYLMDRHQRSLGDYVAVVAATSEAKAEEALELIEVKYEVLPAVFDAEEAMKPEAPRLYPEGNVFGTSKDMFMEKGTHEPGLAEWGDIARGFTEADAVIENTYDVMPQIHTPIETHVCMARWADDELTVWASTHTPWELRDTVAHYFGISQNKVIVLSKYVGGGFGGKYVGRYQILTCLIARMFGGKRVKLLLTREEDQCYARRPRGKIYAKIGAKKDGIITALQLKMFFDIGAYGNFKAGSCGFHHEAGILSYKINNARFEAWDVHTNHYRSECMRSVFVPFITFPIELVVDELSEELGLDPVAIRLKNMPESGDMMPPSAYINNSWHLPQAKFSIYPGKELLNKVLEKIGWKDKWQGYGKPVAVDGSRRRGIGLAYCKEYTGFSFVDGTSISVVINRDGTAMIYSGVQELGQGINTTMRMLAAEALGLSLNDVSIFTGDTRYGQCDFLNARGSHQLATNGHLLLKAIEEAKQKLREFLSPIFGVEPEEIEISGRKAFIKGKPDSARTLPVSVEGSLSPTVTGSASGPPGSAYPLVKPGYKDSQPVVMAAEVEVDTETAIVKPIKIVTGMFPGRVVNQGIVRGQAIGGALQALGMALWEEFKFDESTHTYGSQDLTDYKIPRALDVPEIEPVMLEAIDDSIPHNEGLPYGARGIGEMSCWGGPAVIASAVYNAIGVRINRSPITPEKVLEALANKEAAR